MPAIRLAASLLGILLLCCATTATQAAPIKGSSQTPNNATFSSADLKVDRAYCQKVLNKVDELLAKHFYSKDILKAEWSKARDSSSSKILASKDLTQLAGSVNEALGMLHSSHCHLYTINDETFYFLRSLFSADGIVTDRPPKIDYTGFAYGGIGVAWNQIRYILDNSPGAGKLHLGDKLLFVDGQPFIGQANFFGKARKNVTLVVERNGQRLEVTLVPKGADLYERYCDSIGLSAATFDSPDGKIGYIHSWCGGNRAHRTFDWMLASKLADTSGLILDLRDGYGGNQLEDLDYFYRKPAGYPTLTFKEQGTSIVIRLVYDKPVVALINSGSRSGKELLALSLKNSGRAKLVGERTAGYVLGARLFELDSRAVLYLPVQSVDFAGVNLEGVGVEPDVLVGNPDHSEAGARAQLDQAKVELHNLIVGSSSKQSR